MHSPASPQDLFMHHVLFYMSKDASDADKAALLEGLHLLQQIPLIKLAHIGMPAATTRDVIENTYTYSWLCFFSSAEDEERYQRHPLHDEFRTTYAHYWSRVVIYDAIGAMHPADGFGG